MAPFSKLPMRVQKITCSHLNFENFPYILKLPITARQGSESQNHLGLEEILKVIYSNFQHSTIIVTPKQNL